MYLNCSRSALLVGRCAAHAQLFIAQTILFWPANLVRITRIIVTGCHVDNVQPPAVMQQHRLFLFNRARPVGRSLPAPSLSLHRVGSGASGDPLCLCVHQPSAKHAVDVRAPQTWKYLGKQRSAVCIKLTACCAHAVPQLLRYVLATGTMATYIDTAATTAVASATALDSTPLAGSDYANASAAVRGRRSARGLRARAAASESHSNDTPA